MKLSYEYIVNNFEYDKSREIRDVYNFIKDRRGVCKSYTELYGRFLDKIGIENSYITEEDINHIWNTAKINDDWFYYDLTWEKSGQCEFKFYKLDYDTMYSYHHS